MLLIQNFKLSWGVGAKRHFQRYSSVAAYRFIGEVDRSTGHTGVTTDRYVRGVTEHVVKAVVCINKK